MVKRRRKRPGGKQKNKRVNQVRLSLFQNINHQKKERKKEELIKPCQNLSNSKPVYRQKRKYLSVLTFYSLLVLSVCLFYSFYDMSNEYRKKVRGLRMRMRVMIKID